VNWIGHRLNLRFGSWYIAGARHSAAPGRGLDLKDEFSKHARLAVCGKALDPGRLLYDSHKHGISGHLRIKRSGCSHKHCLRVLDVLTWRHALESNLAFKGPGQRVVICPDFLTKLGLVLATGRRGSGRSTRESWTNWTREKGTVGRSFSRKVIPA
jgi:hypothetical protein